MDSTIFIFYIPQALFITASFSMVLLVKRLAEKYRRKMQREFDAYRKSIKTDLQLLEAYRRFNAAGTQNEIDAAINDINILEKELSNQIIWQKNKKDSVTTGMERRPSIRKEQMR